MKIPYDQVMTPSRLQPNIFNITKSLSVGNSVVAIVNRKQVVLSYLISPKLFESLLNKGKPKSGFYKKIQDEYAVCTSDNEFTDIESASLNDLADSDLSVAEIEYYNNL